jgi:hypothetical protein
MCCPERHRYKQEPQKLRLKPTLAAPVFRQLSAQGHWLLFFCGDHNCERSGPMNFGLGPLQLLMFAGAVRLRSYDAVFPEGHKAVVANWLLLH